MGRGFGDDKKKDTNTSRKTTTKDFHNEKKENLMQKGFWGGGH